MRDFAFGQYYPTGSVVHRLDPRVKIILSLFYLVIIFFVVSYVTYLIVALFLLFVVLISKIPFMSVLKSVKAVIFLLIFTAVLNIFFYKEGKVVAEWGIIVITAQGIDFAVKMILRLSLLVMGSSVLMFTSTPTEITDGMEYLMTPLKFVRFPVHDVAIIMSIALRFIPTLMEEADKIIMAQKARGAAFDCGKFTERVKAVVPILIPLFASSFRRAEELALALDTRCYDATPKRTRMKKLKAGWKDFVAVVIVAALGTVILLDKYYFLSFDRMIENALGWNLWGA